MRFCPRCNAVFRRDIEYCALDGARLSSSENDPWIGRTAGRYRIDTLIGAGTMGRVYLATHIELNAHYALKLLYGELAADREVVARFRREAQTLGRLRHPNIVAVVDYEANDGGVPYLVMEHAAGRSLRELIESSGPLDRARAMKLASQIAAALAEAHGHGFVHRDLKPANVRVTELPTGEHAKVVDFGLVGWLGVEDVRITRSEITIGTPAYMAPEQTLSANVGSAADVYSLGVILHEMVSGDRLFEGSVETILENKTTFPAPRLESGDRLASLVARLLERDPSLRPTALEAHAELAAMQLSGTPAFSGEGEETIGPTPSQPRTRRARWGVPLLMGCTLAALTASIADRGWLPIPGQGDTSDANGHARRARAAAPAKSMLRAIPLRLVILHGCDPRAREQCAPLVSTTRTAAFVALLDELYAPADLVFYVASTEYVRAPGLSRGDAVPWELARDELAAAFPEVMSWVGSGRRSPRDWLSVIAACGGHASELPVFVLGDAEPARSIPGRGVIAGMSAFRESSELAAAIAGVFGVEGVDPARLWSTQLVDAWSSSVERPLPGFTEVELEILRGWARSSPWYSAESTELPCPALDRTFLEVPDDQLWWSNGDLSFERKLRRVAVDRYRVTSGDFDGDKRDDILFHQPGPKDDPMWTFEGRIARSRYVRVNGAYLPHAGDLDGDRIADVLWIEPASDTARIWWMRSGDPEAVGSIERPLGSTPIAGDFDGDGRDDVFWWSEGHAPEIVWFEGRDVHKKESVPRRPLGTPIAGDFDGDGSTDLFWYRPTEQAEDEIWWGGPLRRFLATTEHVQVGGAYTPCAGDFNGDGRDDILWNRTASTKDAIWLGRADRRFDRRDTGVWIDLQCVPGDFDGDGRDDIFWYERLNASDETELP